MSEYRDYTIEGDKTFGHKLIKKTGKGPLPMVLRGSYSNETFAKRAIDLFLEGTDNGKASDTDRVQ